MTRILYLGFKWLLTRIRLLGFTCSVTRIQVLGFIPLMTRIILVGFNLCLTRILRLGFKLCMTRMLIMGFSNGLAATLHQLQLIILLSLILIFDTLSAVPYTFCSHGLHHKLCMLWYEPFTFLSQMTRHIL